MPGRGAAPAVIDERGRLLLIKESSSDDAGGFPAASSIPQPVTNALHQALADVVAGRRGVVRAGLARFN